MIQRRLGLIRRQRLEKLKKLQELGINPYPSKFEKKHTCAQARALLGKKVKTAGRVRAIRAHGRIAFFDLIDSSGKIQLWFQEKNLGKEKYQLIKYLDVGDFIGVEGRVVKTKAGEITIEVADFQILAKSLRPLPDQWHGLKDVEERYRRRYLDLILNPEVRKVFEIRSRLVRLIREFLDKRGFVEVETPILQPIYGGASARPFITHHHALNYDFYLRISDELYLKRLIVGGFEKVYEVCRDFRNEGIDRQHNPEFTQVEFYWAYADYHDLMLLTEEMISWLVKKVHGQLEIEYQGEKFDFSPPWPRVTFSQLLKKEIGVDIDRVQNETDLVGLIRKKGIALDLEGVVGLGAIYDLLYKTFVRPKLKGPLFLLDYPAAMIALAKRKEDDPQKIASFQVLVGGMELVKAYNELNDPLDQRERWLEEEKLARQGAEETERLDEDYIEALEYGMPPTAGWGMGIDRLTMILTNQRTIKDVILFPALRPRKQNSST